MKQEDFCAVALQEAKKAKRFCRPNPAVGAVLVKGNVIVSRGHTQARFHGGMHAEVHAIEKGIGKTSLKGSTLYVTLTPCVNQGRTLPCIHAIRRAGIDRVVIGTPDPSPGLLHRAHGYFRSCKVRYAYGFPREMCEVLLELNFDFFYRLIVGRPLIITKYAMTLDGKMATYTGDSKWITGRDARSHVHLMRRKYDAILIGARTANIDDPQLTVRLGKSEKTHASCCLIRIVVCTKGRVLKCKNLFLKENVHPTVFIVQEDFTRLVMQIKREGQNMCYYQGSPYDAGVMNRLSKDYGINSILVEGGGRTQNGFLLGGLVDGVDVYLGAKVLGDGKHGLSPFFGKDLRKAFLREAFEFERQHMKGIGDDVYVSFMCRGHGARKEMIKQKVLNEV